MYSGSMSEKICARYGREIPYGSTPNALKGSSKRAMRSLTSLETNFINTCAEAVELMDEVGHPNFVLHQDVKAMLSETTPIPELIKKYAAVTGHFHVNDDNLLGPGMGRTDYRPIVRALLESGYAGWVSVEVFDYKPGAEVIARQSIEYLKRMISDVTSS